MTRTHRTRVGAMPRNSNTVTPACVYLQPDWAGCEVMVVDLADIPAGLTPSLTDDGTATCLFMDLPPGWEWRRNTTDPWSTHTHVAPRDIVQCRPTERWTVEWDQEPLRIKGPVVLSVIAWPTNTGQHRAADRVAQLLNRTDDGTWS